MKYIVIKLYLHLKTHIKPTVKAFSLVETSLVLVIIGVLLGAVLKGKDLLDQAKVHSVASDIQNIKLAFQSYQDTYDALPGDDSKASEHFGATTRSGDGDGIIHSDLDRNLVWEHLFKAGAWASSQVPSSKFGGAYQIVHTPHPSMSGHWIALSGPDQSGLLTPQQAQKIMTKLDERGVAQDPTQGSIRAQNGNNQNDCLTGNSLNLNNKNKSCVLFIQIN